ncbi:GPO family capsid scaffolding protein [Microbulbifer variabilis]|uniref:GPO family capsid scaffolding protein n=1 Tax=Microbulbifer variabilis TaxID=266805 RepID=UPI001CFDC273|nr:GPO family capsid scaffolding protein [Microbulbifer variabilis]
MSRKLSTDFVKVATSGPTIDGRNIGSEEIEQMAESYDPEEYTANIWYEHIRIFGNFGKVLEVKAEKDSKGRMCLFARLSPTDELMYLNNRGQKLFTSIEIQPNFADSGKAYLAGLAVTDSPASLGTSELQFSRAQNPENYFSSAIEIPTLELEGSQGLFSRFLKSIGRESETTTPPEQREQGSDAMNEKQFTQLMGEIKSQNEKIEALGEKYSQFSLNDDKGESDKSETEETVSLEAYNALKTKVDDLEQKFSDALKTEVKGTEVLEGSGGAEEEVI